MKRHFSILLTILLSTIYAQSQSTCGCDHVITQSGIYTQSTTTGTFNRNILPGQTVCIMAGNYNLLRFKNFVGSATQPILFKNCGGLVTIGHGAYYAALDFQNCRYFRVTGAGDPSIKYGFRVDSCGTASAMSVGALSSDSEVDHIEIAKAGFAGIMVKTDPDCNTATWRENFTMYNVNIHDNYVHDVGGEGFYVGNSFFGSGMTFPCAGISTTAFPHNIYNLKIHHNIVRRSGAECLQYACAPDAQVYNNDLETCGISPFASFQNNGLQCGGGAGGNCYNNRIVNIPASGLAVIGLLGNNRFYNNLLVNCGGDGVFCDDRAGSLPNTYCDFINNTIINSGRDAMRLYNEINTITLANNVIVGTGSSVSTGTCIVFQQGATATQLNNYCSKTRPVAGLFTDTTTYRLAVGSPLINTGADVSSYGVNFDMDGSSRPKGGRFDMGAYEFDPTVIPIELIDFQGFNNGKTNRLSWHFAEIKDLENIEIQKSADGIHFTTLYVLKSDELKIENNGEKILDEYPFSITYYRLKIKSVDGLEVFSKTIALKLNEVKTVKIISVSPNPTPRFLTVQFENPMHKALTFNLFNVLGQLVLSEKTDALQTEKRLDTEGVAKGVYILKINDGQTTTSLKFTKR